MTLLGKPWLYYQIVIKEVKQYKGLIGLGGWALQIYLNPVRIGRDSPNPRGPKIDRSDLDGKLEKYVFVGLTVGAAQLFFKLIFIEFPDQDRIAFKVEFDGGKAGGVGDFVFVG